jgi:hypothetical protein
MRRERIPSDDHSQALGRSGVSQDAEQEVQRLLAAGKCKQAVELAKEQHKRGATAQSQQLLVQAYVGRIAQFQSKGMDQEAQTLLTLVQQRFPSERHQLSAMEVRAAAAGGRIQDLLRPLASDPAPEIRLAIESAVSRHLTDLAAVAACEVLPRNHPLRIGAARVWHAFMAVTSGPVSDADIELPEISRRSPLAAWKMLIRAIAAYYRHDDAACRRAIDAIPAEASVAHAASAVRSLLDGKKPASGIAAAIYTRVRGDDQALLAAMKKLEESFELYDQSRLENCIRDTVRACSKARPEMVDRLRTHISIACFVHDAPSSAVAAAMGPAIRNAYFWRLLARATESHGSEANASMLWERFLRHAVHEHMFGASSMEAAAVWLHIADLLGRLTLDELDEAREFFGKSRMFSDYYRNQSSEIAAVWTGSDASLADDVLVPGRAFGRAAAIRPEAEVFQQWWRWAEKVDLPPKAKEEIALEWHRGRPRDSQPLLILSGLAETRNALSLALKRLCEAEAIDPLSQQVRQARVRLTMSIAWRHFADKKPHLVEKDLAELAAMPGMVEGDRAAVLDSLRAAWHELRGDQAGQAASAQAVSERLGAIAAAVVLQSIAKMAMLAEQTSPILLPDAPVPAMEIVLIAARLLRLGEDLRLKLWMPVAWTSLAAEVFRQRPCPLSDPDLLALGRAAVRQSQYAVAYAASSAGLARNSSPGITARFLLLRARSLTASWHRPRTTQCLRAALELARQAHDDELITDVFATIDRDPFSCGIISGARNGQGMAEDVLAQVLKSERDAAEFPQTPSDAGAFVVPAAEPENRRRFGGFEDRLDTDWEDEEEEGDFEDDDDDEELEPGLFDLNPPRTAANISDFDVPPEIWQEMRRAVENKELPSNPMLLLRILCEGAGKKFDEEQMRAMAELLKTNLNGPGGASFPGARQSRKGRR